MAGAEVQSLIGLLFLTSFNSTLSYFSAIPTLLCSFKFEFHFLPPSLSTLICTFDLTSYSHFLAISTLNDCSLVVFRSLFNFGCRCNLHMQLRGILAHTSVKYEPFVQHMAGAEV